MNIEEEEIAALHDHQIVPEHLFRMNESCSDSVAARFLRFTPCKNDVCAGSQTLDLLIFAYHPFHDSMLAANSNSIHELLNSDFDPLKGLFDLKLYSHLA